MNATIHQVADSQPEGTDYALLEAKIPSYRVRIVQGGMHYDATPEWVLGRYILLGLFHQTVTWADFIKESLDIRQEHKKDFNVFLTAGKRFADSLEKSLPDAEELFEAGEVHSRLLEHVYNAVRQGHKEDAFNMLALLHAWATNDRDALTECWKGLGQYLSQLSVVTPEMPA